jgi:RNA polymerase sigma-70 factor (ECF subfamily)
VTYTDQELLTLAKQFDQDALAEIYDRYSTALFRYAYRIVGSQQIAEDCVSETFIRFLKSLQAGRGPRENLRGYLYRIAHNWITDQFRRQKPVNGLEDYEEVLEADSGGVEDSVIGSETAHQLRRYLGRLKADQQQVIALKHLEGMSNKEVAEIMGRNVGSVKALHSRGLNNLRKFIRLDGSQI